MTGYLVRRLLLMVPTFIGILLLNFAILRWRAPSLVEVAQTGQAGSDGVAAERKATGASRQYENHIDRFRRLGSDLPALVNLRGFLGRDDLLATLRACAPDSPLPPSRRNEREKELWLTGRFAVAPLAEILRDDALADLHAPASQALALCAYASLDPGDAERLSVAEVQRIRDRNERLRNHVWTTGDPAAATKRAVLLALIDDPANQSLWHPTTGERYTAIVAETGFVVFFSKLLTGDLYSETRKRYVFDLVGERWATTAWLNGLSIAIAYAVSILIGIRAARRAGGIEDRVTTQALFLLWSLPTYFVGALLLHFWCTDRVVGGTVREAWFPNIGTSSDGSMWFGTFRYLGDLAWHAALPLLVLTYGSFTTLSRYLRGNLLEQLGADYARTARAKGCDEDRVVYHHCARNSLITLITLSAGLLAELFGGVLVVERLFSIPGLGQLTVEAAVQQDIPLVMGSTVISVALLLVGILIADLLYAVVDPRVRSRYV